MSVNNKNLLKNLISSVGVVSVSVLVSLPGFALSNSISGSMVIAEAPISDTLYSQASQRKGQYPNNGISPIQQYPIFGTTQQYPNNGIRGTYQYPNNGISPSQQYPLNSTYPSQQYPIFGTNGTYQYPIPIFGTTPSQQYPLNSTYPTQQYPLNSTIQQYPLNSTIQQYPLNSTSGR